MHFDPDRILHLVSFLRRLYRLYADIEIGSTENSHTISITVKKKGAILFLVIIGDQGALIAKSEILLSESTKYNIHQLSENCIIYKN